jgi:hypothetical protein
MELNNYQEEIISKIITSYEREEKSIWIEMPVGSGKTVIAMAAIERLVKKNVLQSFAFVSSHKVLQSYFEGIVSKYNLKSIASSFTYKEINNLINQGKILKDNLELIICDEAELGNEILESIYNYFTAFKIGLARPGVSQSGFLKGPTLRYKIENLVTPKNFFTFQQNIQNNYFNIIENAIESISIGSNWTNSIKEELIAKIDYLQNERDSEFKKVNELLNSGKIDSTEIVEISYRKEQLYEFFKLLHDDSFFATKSSETSGDEAVWQNFFEKNPWIFGFSLNYIFNSPLDGKKLEQTVVGYSITGSGKRTDALLKTNGIIQSLCFGEIKTHKKEILKISKTPYRPESWAISEELAGGIAQVQRTVQKSLYNIQNALQIMDDDGFMTKEKLYLYKPKAFLLIGCLNEFRNSEGNIHEEKFSSFEIFRRSLNDIEIITFDELYERANAIINKRWKL